MTALELAKQLRVKFGELLSGPGEFRGELTLNVSDAERIVEICTFAKKELGFDFLVDISSVDNYGDDPRWTIVYELYGVAHRQYLRLKTNVNEEKSELPTVTSVWRTADWHEREIYDMMGIRFRGHPDLRRIIMWEGYPYFPLRKDFPLAGKPSDVPEVAFTQAAPIEGGPFVTVPGGKDAIERGAAGEKSGDNMKNKKQESLLGKVIEKNYDVSGADDDHSPVSTLENIRRHDKILAKMRKAGITEEEIDFLLDFNQADAVHVQKLVSAHTASEARKKSVN